MNNKILLGIAIIAIGIFVLPQTYSLFAGQHNFYDTTQTGNQVPCLKCHADIQSELNQPGNVNEAHNIVDCEGCHITSISENDNVHASGTIECISCHNSRYVYQHTTSTQCTTCHGNYPIIIPEMDAANIKGNNESHKTFAIGAEQSNLMRGMNEACIGCHTHTQVNITWSKPTTLEFKADNSNGTWEVNSFEVTGSNVVKTTG